MRLPEFILGNMEAILKDWESFAASLLPAAADMTSLALRNHARQILEAVVKDLRTDQTREEQAEKSKGRAPKAPGAPETAAQTHAVLRAKRVRHQSTGRRIPGAAGQRTEVVD